MSEDSEQPTRVEATLMRGVHRVAGVADELVHHPAPNGARAFVNAFFGDRLHDSGSPLSHTMGVRLRGRSVPLTTDGFTHAFPEPSGEVVVLVHGLIVTETFWDAGRFGPRLQEDLGLTPVTVRYNTGLRISRNGRELDRVLTALVEHWPVPVTRLVLLGHSMGGLVIHSALAQSDVDAPWVSRVSDTVTLGSPHLGAPLERSVNRAARAANALRHVRPLARALGVRSVGIQDLGRGNILDEEWDGPEPAGRTRRRVDVPLHPGIRHQAVVGLLGKRIDSKIAQLFGDGIVTAASARGAGRHVPESRRFAREDVVILPGVSHLALVHDDTVYAAVRDRLAATVDP
ncbi:MAG: alpha/beta hydrolase [Knoellia sp.]